jgi:hypothetical protein
VIGESGKIGNYWDSDFSWFLARISDSGKIGNDREWILAICFGDNQPCVCASQTLPFCHVTNRRSRRGKFSTKTLVSPRVSHRRLIIRIMSSTLSPIDVILRLHVSSLASSE